MFDIHKETAARMFSVPVEDVAPEQRRLAKRRNFLKLYGDEETPEQEARMDKLWLAMRDVL